MTSLPLCHFRSCISNQVKPIEAKHVIAIGNLKINKKFASIWSLYISALATSGYSREAFETIDSLDSEGQNLTINCQNSSHVQVVLMRLTNWVLKKKNFKIGT
jgi:hypothetical protein